MQVESVNAMLDEYSAAIIRIQNLRSKDEENIDILLGERQLRDAFLEVKSKAYEVKMVSDESVSQFSSPFAKLRQRRVHAMLGILRTINSFSVSSCTWHW